MGNYHGCPTWLRPRAPESGLAPVGACCSRWTSSSCDWRRTRVQMPIPVIEPLDEHNTRLLAHVHPPRWRNPAPRDRYHLVVIGAGTAGLVTAAGAAALGAKVALVERSLMGGDCLNVGCVPSKAVIAAARAWHAARTADSTFGGPRVVGEGDFGTVMKRMRRLRANLSATDSAQRFTELGVDVFLGEGRFTGPESVTVAGSVLRFRRAVIAAGARAAVPSIPGIEEAGYYTNETIFTLTERPERLLVLGAGPIGCELAQAFARLGSTVTVLDHGDRALKRDDPDAARTVEEALRADGVRFRFKAEIVRAERAAGGVRLHLTRNGRGEMAEGDALLVAAGRAPNVGDLDLEAAGVAFGERGVVVDDRLRTTNPRVYAIGDVASRYQFTHAADAQARLVLANALFFGRGRASRLVVPWSTYTSPEVAHVGLTAAAAAEQGVAVDTITVPLEHVDRALLAGETQGFVRVHVRRGSDRLVGVTVVGPDAGDLIAEAALAMTNGLGLSAMGRTIHPYPTVAEAYRKAADQWRRGKLTPLARRVLGLWFRVFH
jgi:pyruvate/2-oxoglutarate dehydrogenase complex dihydrolipoamide dehydrogenase (E3) component